MVDKERSREIRCKIRGILMTEWDPIGDSDIPEAADEYDLYISGAYDLVESGVSEAILCAYLLNIEVNRMEMIDASGQPLMPQAKRSAVASSLKLLSKLLNEG